MAAFSYGGLEPYICSDEELETDESEEEAEDDHVNLTLANVKEGTELQQPAQAPLNFCLGTSECNTHILRWETAWKKLFQRESGVRQNKMNTTKMVEGSLTICNNSHLKVFEPRKGDSTNFISKPFEEHKELSEIWKTLSFLIFAMEYRVEMKDGSVLLQTEDSEGNFTQTAEFYPFQRQLTTRAECKMDDLVLNTIVNKAKVQKGKKKLHLL
ncbi:hypothetical protein N7466_011661 [Penicillium verhagenii]|uniref:uncharacterized protein n=1 Tax=Penicillium verhagenii TaxID=1562060 RepID=UPI00254575DE|nr:uncharacterized protein N7466_011661 [Penicillium verhagenii]KAJ5915728.1 hypothetical protein N7466_011661 [Penicillium verhagenii]